MPKAGRSWGATGPRSVAASLMLPVACVKPMTLRATVVLPAPLRPMRAAVAPAGNANETLRSTCAPAIDTLTWSNDNMLSDPVHLLADDLVGHYRGRRADGLDLACVPHRDAIRIAGHHIHIVLDEHRGDPLLVE